jgi:hypothetical protein
VRGIAVQPAIDRAGRRVQHHAKAAERPAVVGDRHEEAGRQPVERADLAADKRDLAAESHRPDIEVVDRRHDRRLELREPRIGIDVVERAEQLLFGVRVAGRAVAADRDADRARRAPLALRVPDGVQDASPHAVERPIRPPEVRQLHGQRVLRVRVLAAAAFQNQLDLDRIALPLIEVDDWRARPEVVARIGPRDRIDRVRPQFAAACGFRDRLANLLPHPDLVRADRRFYLEGRHPGVLTDRALAIGREVDVLRDDRQRLRGPRAFGFGDARHLHRGAHVWRQIGRGSDDELEDAVEEGRKHPVSILRAKG